MSLIKYANVEAILEVKSSPRRLSYQYGEEAGTRLDKFAALNDGFRKEDGYLYVRCRAISSRVNKNNDGWPSEELMGHGETTGYKTFIGRPIFVDHNNEDPRRTRGVVVDSVIHVDDDEKTSSLDPYYSTAPDNHKPPTWIELLMEVDGETYPKLAQAIESGDLDAVSMGANIDRSICSVCSNEATHAEDYCSHVKQKGMTFEITADNGEKIKKKAYEDCYGVNFFEISNVFDPADETADSGRAFKAAKIAQLAAERGLDPDEVAQYLTARGDLEPGLATQVGKTLSMDKVAAYKREALLPAEQFMKPVDQKNPPEGGDRNYIPQSDQVTAPQEVNTLRTETRCPICKASDMQTGADGIMTCPVCGHVQEPEPVDNPDLGVAREVDLRADQNKVTDQDGHLETPAEVPAEQQNPLDSVEFQNPVAARKDKYTSEGISEMKFTVKLRTNSKAEADAIMPVTQKTARVEAKFGSHGIHRGIYEAAKEAGLKVRVSYPAIEREENSLEVPGNNGIFNLFFAEESAAKLSVPMTEVPIVIEGTEEDTQKFLKILEKTEPRRRRTVKRDAADKSPILPESAKPADEPKNEKVVQDATAPKETKAVVVTDDTVELEGKKYRLVTIEDEETKEDAKAEAEDNKADEAKAEKEDDSTEEDKSKDEKDDKESTVEDGLAKAEDLAEEVSDDKEEKLLAAFSLADLSVEMGLIEQENKMAFIAEAEEETLETLEARTATLKLVKEAGFGKRAGARQPIAKIPRLSHAVSATNNGSASFDVPDEALFM